MPNILHDKVFNFCENYREMHPGFVYWLRERNTRKRLEKGMWFQGNDGYAFVGLYDRSGGSNMTRSFGFVFRMENEKISCDIENVFNEESDNKVLEFYEQLRELLGGFEKISETKFKKKISREDGFSDAAEFLNIIKPKIDDLLVQNNLQHLFISENKFKKNLERIKHFRSLQTQSSSIKFIVANLTWNSNNWMGISQDKSGHKWVSQGNVPHESWNFDFNNTRNTAEHIHGFCQFTNSPNIQGNNNLVIFYSQNQIVGFYGEAEILPEPIKINEQESYNIIGSRPLCIVLDKKISSVKEKGYLEDKKRVGQIGFSYLQNEKNIRDIINEAIFLNPKDEARLFELSNWLKFGELNESNYWVFQANPNFYLINEALKKGILLNWMVNQHKSEIQIGDKVILWVSGEKAGVYALATVTSPVHFALDNEIEHEFYIDKANIKEKDRVNLRLDFNLVDRLFLKDQILSNPKLIDLKQGIQGTNFPATKQQYETLLNIILMDSNYNEPLNQILFGPPGTGKTYHTITESIKIVDQEFYKINEKNRTKLQERFNELLIKDWDKTDGQISFCTFHQSFSYEDFVEGIKPLKPEVGDTSIKYDIISGIFKKICRLADASTNAQKLAKENLISMTQEEFNKAIFYKLSLGDSTKEEDKEIYDYCITNSLISIGFGPSIDFTGKDEIEVNELVNEKKLDQFTSQAINYFKNYLKIGNYVVVSYGNSYIRALGKVTGDYEYKPEAEIRYKHFRQVEWIFKNVEIPVNEFYQKNLSQQTIYKLKSEYIIPSFFIRQKKETDSKIEQKKFVLVIDEINRGNVSSILGELITLIEPTKRSGKPEALEVVLPYSKERFSVPPNVYIIGTMNTADRSIEALDTALRRRFSFKELPPKSYIISEEGNSRGVKGVVEEIDLVELLDAINNRIEKLLDKDHMIGHSYFMPVDSLSRLRIAFKDKIIPLLEEYFYGDLGKIGLILGEDFVRQKDSNFDGFSFAKFQFYDADIVSDLKSRKVYSITDPEEWKVSSFQNIYDIKEE